MKCNIWLALLLFCFTELLSAVPPSLDMELCFTLDFENQEFFSNEKCAEHGMGDRCRWRRLTTPGSQIKVFDDKEHHQALQLTRQEKLHTFILNGTKEIPSGYDYKVSADFYMEANDGIFCIVRDPQGEQAGGVNVTGASPIKVLHDGGWCVSDLLVPNGWCRVEMLFRPTQRMYFVSLILPDGTKKTYFDRIFKGNGRMGDVWVGTIPPEGRKGVIDNIQVCRSRSLSTEGRENVVESADVAASIGAKPIALPFVFEQEANVDIHVNLADFADVSSAEVFGSTTLRCRVRGVNVGGQPVQLGTPVRFIKKTESQQVDFNSSIYQKISFSISGQKGERIDKVAVYKTKAINQIAENERLNARLEGDFALPVYEGNAPAQLHLFNHTDNEFPITVQLRERYGQKVLVPPFEKLLKPGKNIILFAIDALPSGDYFAEISEVTDQKVKGTLTRLLRRQTTRERKAAEITDFSGEKLYMTDEYYLEKCSEITFRQGQAKAIQVSRTQMTEDAVMQHGETIYLNNGKLCVGFYTCDGAFRKVSRKRYLAEAQLDDLEQWEIQRVPADFVHPEPPGDAMHKNRAHYDNAPKKDLNGQIVYRYYDPATDGKVQVNQVEMKYIRTARADAIGAEAPPCIGNSPLPQRTTWAIWHKEPGLSLVLTKKPFLADGYPGDFEEGIESNDNFVGQYFSEDGKTLFYARGCLLRRYDPFNVPYENFRRFGRFITIFKTTDGLNFERVRISLPEENDPVGTQHYGGGVFILPRGNGLHLGYFYRYFAHEQRYGIDLNYSHDGFYWKRYPGQKLFLDNGPVGSWNAGSIHFSRFAVETDDKTIHLLNWSSSGYHFYPGRDGFDGLKNETGESVKKRLAGRHVEEWPFFKTFGSYDKLAESMRNTHINVGIMVCRRDGFFCATAGEKTGEFVTKKLRACGGMNINAKIENDGRIELSLLDLSGKAIEGYSKILTGPLDNVSEELFAKLPSDAFRVRTVMCKASLFTLDFSK
ncbi:MAG: hypothetical protein GX946_07385 [Oligosphaeraceae bacterium]|nr:hypothetical protein [Oligosphaeraceae bacterium]